MLVVLDGFGEAPADYPHDKNAVALARKPFLDSLRKQYPRTLVRTSGNDVGLPAGVMGNSEVGHLNIGAGRVVWQEITRIDKAIETDGVASNEAFVRAINKARDSGRNLHLMGLVGDGAVHSVDRHYFALLRLAKKLKMPAERVFVHCFLDGRDTPPQSGIRYVGELHSIMEKENLGRIATISGRYYAMDRDKRWERVQKAYDTLVESKGERFASPQQAIEDSYKNNVTDEFVLPRIITRPDGEPIAAIRDGDQIIHFNFRADRARELSQTFVLDDFKGFERAVHPRVELTGMTQYQKGLPVAGVAFPPNYIKNGIGEIVSRLGMCQLRIAETEKYPHVSYFFSGGREKEFDGEERILVPSPKVATYDLQPEMSLPIVAERLAEAIRRDHFDFIVTNFANGDMVGHTGVIPAATKAVETNDAALAKVVPLVLERGGKVLICADHGNAEEMWNFAENCPHTQHTTNPTPLYLVADGFKGSALREGGRLCDIAPTLLEIMGIEKPPDMDGQSLLQTTAAK
ncbi:MAG: 2,3-bisphosphoglycerate-independent phosphoglycerate mutase [bacterium]